MGKKPLSEKQIKSLRKLVDGKPLHELLLNLSVDLMLRGSDLLNLKVADVVSESGTIKTEVKVKQKKTGKNTGNDFNEQKITLPIIHAMSYASSSDKLLLTNVFEKSSSKPGDFERVLEVLEKTKSLEFTEKQAKNWSEKAILSVKKLPESEMRNLLIELSSEIVERKT